MKEYISNKFYKGINTDTSWLERQGDMLLDALNIRITSKEVDGLFAANIKGNVEEFSLSPGFVPIGSTEYNGILFILSVNESTGFSEIGTYPSPKGTSEGFDRKYSPLQNYTLDNPNIFPDLCDGDDPIVINGIDFNTESLKFSCKHQARVLARLTFDKSVNLYWTDNFNPIRSINTGFHSETGIYNNLYTSEGMIETGIIDVISENEHFPVVKLQNLDVFGNLRGGHYFFFVRYIDIGYNTTSFLGMSAPIPVFNESETQNYYAGTPIPAPPGVTTPTSYGTPSLETTNRNIELNISQLDVGAGFFEVGYIYYYDDKQFEILLVDKRFTIDGQSSQSIDITGLESTIPLALDEFIVYKPVDSIFCKDMTQIDNRLYLANTRGFEVDHPDLRKFFCSVVINEDDSLEKAAEHIEQTETNINPYGIDGREVNEEVGYFSGETYCFAGVPILKGGFTGPAFPLKGGDNYLALLSDANYDGIYRFKNSEISNFYKNDKVFVKGVTFNTTTAQGIYDNSTWLQDNLVGIYFCRAERNKNFLYQGLACNTYVGAELYDGPERDYRAGSGNKGNQSESLFKNFDIAMPLIERSFPYIFTNQVDQGIFLGEDSITSYQRYHLSNAISENRQALGIFSFDAHIDRGLEKPGAGKTSFIKKVGYIDNGDWYPRAPYKDQLSPISNFTMISDEYPDNIKFSQNDPTGRSKMFVQKNLTYTSNTDIRGGGFKADTYNLFAWDPIGLSVGGRAYPTKIGEGTLIGGMFYLFSDRADTENEELLASLPLAIPSYVLVDLETSVPDNTNLDQWFNTIVNVYKQDPDILDYKSYYDFKTTFFSTITDFIRITSSNDILNIKDEIFYQGDCFTSRSYIKLHNKFDDELQDELTKFIAEGEAQSRIYPLATTYWEDYFNLGLGEYFDQDESRYFNKITYGYGLSLVTENHYNSNYRHPLGRNTFYPHDSNYFCPAAYIMPPNTPESYFYNTGYIRMLGPRQFVGIDKFKPTSDNSFPTRIRPSFKHILNSLRDGYLQFTPGDFKDFDFQYGPINALVSMNDQLYSFQNDAVNLHPINERGVSQSTATDTPFVLGESKGLTEFKRSLSTEYGTQHQWSIIKGERGIYGFDWNKQVYWRVTGEGFQNLGLTKGCEKWIEDIVALQSTGYSDIMEQLDDNPVCNVGIHSVYDREYREVITTFIFAEEEDSKTISFSEKADIFGAKYSFTPRFYSELERDLYSFKDGKFWRHDANPLYDNFYGQQEPAFVEVVVNPKGEIAKHFDNLILNSNNREFDKITYTTQHQSAVQDPFLGEFWNRAVYREFQWKLPIRRADAIIDTQLSLSLVQSRIRGRYLIINLQYAGDQDMWIREIITAYTQSKA